MVYLALAEEPQSPVYLALTKTPEVKNAGRSVPTRLPARKRGSLHTHAATPPDPLAAQASLSELNSVMMQETQKQEEEELAELTRMLSRPARVRGRRQPPTKGSSHRKSPRDSSDFSNSSSPRDELSDRSVGSAGGLGNVTLTLSEKTIASRVRI